MRAALVLVLVAACEPPHRYGNQPGPYIDAAVPPDGPVKGSTLRTIEAGVSLQGDRSNDPPVDSVPYHEVYLSEYRIYADVVTIELYCFGVPLDQCTTQASFDQISRADASGWCRRYGGELPTEAQLERAMRGDDGDTFQKDPTPFGLFLAPGGAQELVLDDDACDAYLQRNYANPSFASTAGMPQTRSFVLDHPIGARWSDPTAPRRFRCVFPKESGPIVAPPNRPNVAHCSSSSCAASKVALGARFGCAIANNKVWCWGLGIHGELGSGRLDAMFPATGDREVNLGGGTPTALAVGDAFACATTTIGTQCWGASESGQSGTAATDDLMFPVMTGSATWTSLTAAGTHACAIDAGAVTCWGHGGYIAAGTGATTPTAIGVTATAVAAGPTSDCAITTNGVECWGRIYDAGGSQVTVTPANRRVFALTTATQIAVGADHACAVITGGTEVNCWGNRAAWGGTGIAANPELVTSGTALAVFAGANQTVIADGTTIVFSSVTFPANTVFDGSSIAIGTTDAAGLCVTGDDGEAHCRGVDVGQLGHGAGCDASIATVTFL